MTTLPTFADEVAFLQARGHYDFGCDTSTEDNILRHQLITSPLINLTAVQSHTDAFPSRGLLGTTTNGERLYVNTNTPSCGVICGVQGSGKSHTLSCILESSLISDSKIGALPQPLSALVFHFDEQDLNRPAEAAFLSRPAFENATQNECLPKIKVLCSPSNISRRRRAYASLPHVQVEALYLSERDLTAERMLAIMGCDDIEKMPLYMHSVLLIIRNMGVDRFNYKDFKRRLEGEELNAMQRSMVKVRLNLLEAFLKPGVPDIQSYFGAGRLVLVDLTDTFLDGRTASVLFDIVLNSFMQWQSTSGKIVVFDEAHKYLVNSDTARLTLSISAIIRQQRHLSTRIIIATQEPTVIPPTVLDLASFVICHRFTSPSWCTHLSKHVSADNETVITPWFQEVMVLPTGQGVLFSPSAILMKDGDRSVHPLGGSYVKLRVRPRLTLDGGSSLLAVGEDPCNIKQEVPTINTPPPSRPDEPPQTPAPSVLESRTPTNAPATQLHKAPAPQRQPSSPVATTATSSKSVPSRTANARVTPSVVLPTAVTTGTSASKRVPVALKLLIMCLQESGGVNTALSITAVFLKVSVMGKEIYLGRKKRDWFDPLVEQAKSRGLVELMNTDLAKSRHKIRLLHPGPFIWT